MPAVNRGEIWLIDFGLAAKVHPALQLTGQPADNELMHMEKRRRAAAVQDAGRSLRPRPLKKCVHIHRRSD